MKDLLILTALTFSATFFSFYTLSAHVYLKKLFYFIKTRSIKKANKYTFIHNKYFDCFPCWIMRNVFIVMLFNTNLYNNITITISSFLIASLLDKLMTYE